MAMMGLCRTSSSHFLARLPAAGGWLDHRPLPWWLWGVFGDERTTLYNILLLSFHKCGKTITFVTTTNSTEEPGTSLEVGQHGERRSLGFGVTAAI